MRRAAPTLATGARCASPFSDDETLGRAQGRAARGRAWENKGYGTARGDVARSGSAPMRIAWMLVGRSFAFGSAATTGISGAAERLGRKRCGACRGRSRACVRRRTAAGVRLDLGPRKAGRSDRPDDGLHGAVVDGRLRARRRRDGARAAAGALERRRGDAGAVVGLCGAARDRRPGNGSDAVSLRAGVRPPGHCGTEARRRRVAALTEQLHPAPM